LLTKMMTLFGENPDNTDKVKQMLSVPMCGEMTVG